MSEKKNIQKMITEIEETDIESAVKSAFSEQLRANITRHLNKYLVDNIDQILVETYQELSKSLDGNQRLVDLAFIDSQRKFDSRKSSGEFSGMEEVQL